MTPVRFWATIGAALAAASGAYELWASNWARAALALALVLVCASLD